MIPRCEHNRDRKIEVKEGFITYELLKCEVCKKVRREGVRYDNNRNHRKYLEAKSPSQVG